MNARARAFGQDSQEILKLAWPVLVGQLAVLAFGTIDTVLLARTGSVDLAALAVGSAAFLSVDVSAASFLHAANVSVMDVRASTLQWLRIIEALPSRQ